MTPAEIADRLEYLRGEIEAERISYGEIAELEDLAAAKTKALGLGLSFRATQTERS